MCLRTKRSKTPFKQNGDPTAKKQLGIPQKSILFAGIRKARQGLHFKSEWNEAFFDTP